MKQLFITFWLIAGSFFAVQAQTIRISFPYFAGSEYDVYVYRGAKSDTIVHGALDSQGFTQIEIPSAYRGRTGFVSWRLKQGGGLDFIVDGKEMEITCAEARPNGDNVFYTPAVEQNFYMQNDRNRQQLLNKVGALQYILDVYRNDSLSSKASLQEEYTRIQSDYAAWHSRMEASDSYAARYLLARNLLDGIGSRLDLTKDKMILELLDFAVGRLDIDALYTGSLWNSTLESWMRMQLDRQDDALLLKDSKELLSRTSSEEIYKALLNKFIKLYTQFGKDFLLLNFDIDNLLSGDTAPALVAGQAKYTPANAILIFYESGCSHCENELAQLRDNYSQIKEKAYDVISVAADTHPEIFKKTADQFPWKEKFCDYQGFAGLNFKNYTVVGTPTIFVIDKESKIVGRYAKLEDFWKELQK
jgi:peroxiredoxin